MGFVARLRRRRVPDGILFGERTGIPWRDPPTRCGRWRPVCERHRCRSAEDTRDTSLRTVRPTRTRARRRTRTRTAASPGPG
ncbi:hypothetical protein CP969_17455 [Streptomyces viridosporus T7A]|uniref:Transposase n=1 Tax=Streptomyces viridosporus T7A TaxID=665577 RepID=A0ABX6AG82_STRVD|nr:hypothetical protein CP969_17455 [Streptomyces viridosporus T7A]